jgi:multiple sugar transport system ATP-binding protein
VARVPRAERDRRVREVAELLGLVEYLERKPGQLSGGQRQRVAMGRAIIRQPSVFCMDEPLSNLDAKLRVQMRAEIAALQSRLGTTTVYVTHDQAEAMTLGDRVAVLGDGRLQQCDAPRVLYERPANTFVAGFIGSPSMNLCRAAIGEDSSVSVGGVAVPIPREVRERLNGEVVVGLRPEALELSSEGIDAQVEVVEEIGADAYVFAAAELGGEQTKLVARVETRSAPARGERVALRPRAGEAHLFDPATGARL